MSQRVLLDSLQAVATKLSPWSGYFKKAVAERRALLQSIDPNLNVSVLSAALDEAVANNMVENYVGNLALPVGIAPTFVINKRHFVVPMCVEEPSVIAAASSAAKLIAEAGGFVAETTSNCMFGQIQLLDIADCAKAADTIAAHEMKLVDVANTFCESMKRRGGGVKGIKSRIITPQITARRQLLTKPYLVVMFEVDVCEAMGANLVNTIAEGLAPHVADLVGGRAALKILSNLCSDRRAKCTFRVPLSMLAWKGVDGRDVAERVLEAHYFAMDDPYRAVTNNKGIMNGMDAVAIATGQDWRALEAAVHAWASMDGTYQSLTRYHIEEVDAKELPLGPPTDAAGTKSRPDEKISVLTGTIDVPISVGTVGGALQTHPTYKFSHDLLGRPDAKTLAQIIGCVGLAQNFAAIRALATEGIQKGHMALHARNVAAAAGVPTELVAEVARYMVQQNKIHRETAEEYLRSKGLGAAAASAPDPKASL